MPATTPPAPTSRIARPAKSSALGRLLVACWLALHVAVVGAAPLVDALTGHGQDVVPHFEDASDTRCPPQHDDVGCQLAQVVSGGGEEPRSGPELAIAWVGADALRSAAAAQVWHGAQLAPPSTRGPPAA